MLVSRLYFKQNSPYVGELTLPHTEQRRESIIMLVSRLYFIQNRDESPYVGE